jgi:hypothetical protein
VASAAPTIEFLWWRECPSWEEALAELREAARSAGLDPAEIVMREVETDADAERERFFGSPTIRIDGEDLQPPPPDEPLGLTCRIYTLRDGRVSPTPDPADVEAALQQAIQKGGISR